MRPSLSVLRNWLSEHQLDGFILPRSDQYLGEYVAPHDEAVAWMTGFTGSAGFALITQNIAYLYTDGRYQTQAEQELAGSEFVLRHSVKDKFYENLNALQSDGGKLGFDPWLHSIEWHRQIEKKLANTNWQLQAAAQTPMDSLWPERPPVPMAMAYAHPLEFAGESSMDKCLRLGKKLAEQNLAAEFINDPTLVAWLLNIRGKDVTHIPVVHSRALLHTSGAVELFIDAKKLPDAPLEPHIVTRNPNEISQAIGTLKGETIRLPANITPYALMHIAQSAGAKTETEASVVMSARAKKNAVEQNGMRRAHERDARALALFFEQLPRQIENGATEAQVADSLARFRAQQNNYVEESFYPIVGWNENGAIVHYRPDTQRSAKILGSGILLIDSGGQYRDGTTDVTRTIAIGTPTQRQREIYTRVLKGHLAISRAQFPLGTTGSQLDAFARQYLWEVGLDYDHGTGHGVGSFLSVHEGPQSISNKPNTTALEPGMILSNEPGCYLPGEFGIRIENLVMVIPAELPNFLRFETLTFVYYDESLILKSLLTQQELEQIDQYHQRIAEIIVA